MCYYIIIFYFVYKLSSMEICSNASPEYRCWYHIVDDFYGLTIYEIIAIFSYNGVVCVPFFEVDVDVAIKYFVFHFCCLFVNNFCFLSLVVLFNDPRNSCCSFPFWKNEFTWLDDDFVYFTKSGFINDGCQFLMIHFS